MATYSERRHEMIFKLLGLTDEGIKQLERYPIKFIEYAIKKGVKFQHDLLFKSLDIEYNIIETAVSTDIGTLEGYKDFLLITKDPFYYNQKHHESNVDMLKYLRNTYPHLERFFNYLDEVKPEEIDSVDISNSADEIREIYYARKVSENIGEGQQQ